MVERDCSVNNSPHWATEREREGKNSTTIYSVAATTREKERREEREKSRKWCMMQHTHKEFDFLSVGIENSSSLAFVGGALPASFAPMRWCVTRREILNRFIRSMDQSPFASFHWAASQIHMACSRAVQCSLDITIGLFSFWSFVSLSQGSPLNFAVGRPFKKGNAQSLFPRLIYYCILQQEDEISSHQVRIAFRNLPNWLF